MGIWAGGVEAGAGDTLKLTLTPVLVERERGYSLTRQVTFEKRLAFLVCHQFDHSQ